jgi:hypothetical protein
MTYERIILKSGGFILGRLINNTQHNMYTVDRLSSKENNGFYINETHVLS